MRVQCRGQAAKIYNTQSGVVVLWEAEAGGWRFPSTTLVRQSLTQELHTDTLTLDSSYLGLLKYSEVRPKDTKT